MLQQHRARLRNGLAKDLPGPSDASSKGLQRRRLPIRRPPEARHRRPEARYGGLARHASKMARQVPPRAWLERDDFSANRHPALSFCLSMIFSENRFPLFRIML